MIWKTLRHTLWGMLCGTPPRVLIMCLGQWCECIQIQSTETWCCCCGCWVRYYLLCYVFYQKLGCVFHINFPSSINKAALNKINNSCAYLSAALSVLYFSNFSCAIILSMSILALHILASFKIYAVQGQCKRFKLIR